MLDDGWLAKVKHQNVLETPPLGEGGWPEVRYLMPKVGRTWLPTT